MAVGGCVPFRALITPQEELDHPRATAVSRKGVGGERWEEEGAYTQRDKQVALASDPSPAACWHMSTVSEIGLLQVGMVILLQEGRL